MLTQVIFVSLGLASLALAPNAAVPAKQSYMCTTAWLVPDSSSNHFAGGAELAAGKYQAAFNNFSDEISTADHAEMFAGQERNSKEVAQDDLTGAANRAGAAAAMFGAPTASFMGSVKNFDLALGYLREARDHLASATTAWPKPVTAVAVKDIRTYVDQLAKAKKPLLPDCLRR
jgi:hypothetical protein